MTNIACDNLKWITKSAIEHYPRKTYTQIDGLHFEVV